MDKLNEIYDSKTFIDLYADLNVNENASTSEIKKAYLKLAKVHHPDQGGNEESFRRITRAYEILSNKKHRSQYDSYYIRKNINNDEIFRFKEEFKKHVADNTKKLSKNEIKNMFDKEFTNYTLNNNDNPLTNSELQNRINDLEFERNDFENNLDNDISQYIKDNDININDIYDYNLSQQFDNNKNNSELQLAPYEPFNSFSCDGTMCMYSSIVNDGHSDSNAYSFINKLDENTINPNDIDIQKIKSWKLNKTNINNSKLSDKEFNDYINSRIDYSVNNKNKN